MDVGVTAQSFLLLFSSLSWHLVVKDFQHFRALSSIGLTFKKLLGLSLLVWSGINSSEWRRVEENGGKWHLFLMEGRVRSDSRRHWGGSSPKGNCFRFPSCLDTGSSLSLLLLSQSGSLWLNYFRTGFSFISLLP